MMGGGWLYLLSAGWLVAVVVGQELGVTMCCPAGRVLKIVKNNGRRLGGWGKERGDEYIPKCVRNRRAPKDTLEESSIAMDGAVYDIKKTGVQLPACTLGRKFQMVSLSDTDVEGSGEGSGDDIGEVDTTSRVRLGDYRRGKSKCHKGNVYVDDKPVCDDGWDDTDANVVCKELGFTAGGYSTKESYFGKVDLERQSGFDEVRCSGRESSLVDCRHESHDDCGDSEGAGVVCYQDYDDNQNSDQDIGPQCIETNTDYDGNDIELIKNTQSAQECACNCWENAECSFFTWNGADKNCWLKNSDKGREPWSQGWSTPYNQAYSGSRDCCNSGSSASAGAMAPSVVLTNAGDLVLADNTTYKAGEFCMAGVFQGEGEWDKEVQEGEAVAVMCEPCKSEVLCSVILNDFFGSFPGDEIEADERSFGTKNVVLIGDTNKDGKVDFKEFKAGVDDYIKKVFNVLDKDGDGSLDKDISLISLSANFFLQLLDEVFLFFDVNEDDILCPEDAPPRTFYDRNDDGKISLRELFGT